MAKEIIENEVAEAWEALKKKAKPKEDKEEEIEEQNLEETITPKEIEFVSMLPEKAPSLELQSRQNLETAVGPPASGKKEEETEARGYSPKKDYAAVEGELEFAEEITARAPRIFERTDITSFATKRKALHMQDIIPAKPEEVMEYTTKDFREREMEFSFEKKTKKYKPFRAQ